MGMKHFVFLFLVLIISFTGCSARNQSEIVGGISAQEIIKSINKGKPVLVQGKTITDELDFASIKKQVVISSTQLSANVDVPVTFLNCIFVGKVTSNGVKGKQQITTNFSGNVTFEGCDFRSDFDMSNCVIEGVTNFAGAKFRENALFNNASFKGDRTYFTSALTEKMFSMQEAAIWGNADFFGASFKSKVSFQSTDFKGVAQFSNLQCNGKAEFSLCTFRSNALFTYAKFSKDLRFSNTRCHANCNMVSMVCDENIFINNSLFSSNVLFSNTEIKGVLDLSGTVFVLGKPEMEGLKLESPDKLIITNTNFIGVSK